MEHFADIYSFLRQSNKIEAKIVSVSLREELK